MRVAKGTNLSRPQLREAVINLLSLGISITDASRILGVSTYLVRCLAKGERFQAKTSERHRLAEDSLHNDDQSEWAYIKWAYIKSNRQSRPGIIIAASIGIAYSLAMYITKQPVNYNENDYRRDQAAAEFPGNQTGKASPCWTFHSFLLRFQV